ncbi:MAG: alpha/beta fold hydrolase [Bacteroidetes bacterium]|nr:alpha/beta fold hydrolase [Bacteroidota bacterium]
MKSLKVVAVFAFSIFLGTSVSGQDFLNNYFNGNKDTLIAEATKLVNMPEPTFKPLVSTWIDTTTGKRNSYKAGNAFFVTRDKQRLFAYKFPKKSPNTIILIHGVKSDGRDYLQTATMLQQATQAEVYAIDLRGHGKSYGKSGDVDYINQYADDIADIIKNIRSTKPDGKIVIAGHSMGGGITLKYAMSGYKEKVDGFLLFAPLLGQNSPAFPQGQAEAKDTTEPFMKIHIARIIGLKMLNEINMHQQDSLPVLFFNLPKGTPLREYSYRANASMAPDNYVDGLKAVKIPMLVLIGNKDEAFVAEAQQKAVVENSIGELKIIDGATHESILQNPACFQAISKWYSKL